MSLSLNEAPDSGSREVARVERNHSYNCHCRACFEARSDEDQAFIEWQRRTELSGEI